MSDYERNIGKFWPVEMTEEEAERLCKEREIDDYRDGFKSWVDCLCCESDDYIKIEPLGVCKVEHECHKDIDFCDIIKNEDGSYRFHTLHYNGGAYYTEVIEAGLKKLNETTTT